MDEQHKKPIVNLPASDLPQKPLTADEVEEEIHKRISRIDHEFKAGFEFIKNQTKSVTFFGSSRFAPETTYCKLAEEVAARLAKEGYTVFSGGGPGIMEAANKGAKEAGGDSIGLTISLPHEQVRNPYVTDYMNFYYFFTRKVMLAFSAEAYIFFPGGFGTLDEFFEILTLVQTNKIEKVPIIVMGSDYWNPLQDFIRLHMYEKNAAIDKNDMGLYLITDNVDHVVDIVRKTPVRDGVPYRDETGETIDTVTP